VVKRGRLPSSADQTENRADELSGVVGTGCEGSFVGKRGRSRLSRVMAAMAGYKGDRKPSQASEESEG